MVSQYTSPNQGQQSGPVSEQKTHRGPPGKTGPVDIQAQFQQAQLRTGLAPPRPTLPCPSGSSSSSPLAFLTAGRLHTHHRAGIVNLHVDLRALSSITETPIETEAY